VTTPSAASLLRWAEVDVGALEHNIAEVRSLLAPGTQLMAMVKSNGYGHGLLHAAEGAIRGGASWLGVYHSGEALALRAAGNEMPILVVGALDPAALHTLVEARVDITITDPEELRAIAQASLSPRPRVHLKIDTGLNRIGVRPELVGELLDALAGTRDRVEVTGVFTHFADADAVDTAFTVEQHRRFLDAVAALRPAAPECLLHAAGSAAILRLSETHHDLVRLGIAMYGYAPAHTQPPPLRVAMSLFARVVQVKTLPRGDTVGYGRTWTAPAPACIATVALGYGQGVRRAFSNRGCLAIRGVRCPIVGIVSMDQLAADVSAVEGVTRGDQAMFFGEQDGVRLGADEVAGMIETIPHEVICAVPPDIPRVLRRG
jgi:alanine racemase